MEGVMMDEGPVVGKERSGVVMEELEAKNRRVWLGVWGRQLRKLLLRSPLQTP
jgi:hypothetical protein